MRDLYSKTNAPYLIAGAFATLALLASGTLAVAPYVAFLSPIAAFNVALPVALSLSILSTLILALSCKMISRNKKLAAKGAELNEKIELAAEQENTIQSLELQIKGLNKKVSDLETKLDEISKQTNGAATKEGLNKKVSDLETKLDKISKQTNGAATKEGLNKLSDEMKKLGTSAATKDEVEGLNKKLNGQHDEIVNLRNSAATKEGLNKLSDEVKELVAKIGSAAKKEELKKLSDEVEKLIGSLITKEELEERLDSLIKEVEVKEELQMKFYGKGEEREKITFDDVILPNDIKQKLIRICEPNALGKGCILYGPPGTGKTMIAKAVASETRFKPAFISVSGSDLLNVSNINRVFEEAKKILLV